MELDDSQSSPAASVRAESAEPPSLQSLLQGSGSPSSPPRAGQASVRLGLPPGRAVWSLQTYLAACWQ